MNHPSIDMIAVVASAFEQIGVDVLFVGGTVVPLYVPEHMWSHIRPTNDVDGVVQIESKESCNELKCCQLDRSKLSGLLLATNRLICSENSFAAILNRSV